jgi:hypothetical protein
MTARPRRNVPGTVYLIHLHELYMPYPGAPAGSCAQHYTGFAEGGARALVRRLAEHGTASGARFLYVARQAGITWELARTWEGTRAYERSLKNRGSARRYCPLCGIVPRPAPLPRNRNGSISRSRVPDWQKGAAGLMTAAELAEHTTVRRGLATGRVPGVDRLVAAPADDPWYAVAS